VKDTTTMSRRSPVVRYHLRATLTPEHHTEEERALRRIIKNARVDEVMFFVPHAEERSSGLGSDEEHEQMAAILGPVFARLRRLGVAPSINIWWTVAFSEFPGLARDLRDRFDFRWAVGVDGRESHSVACPRCPAWRSQTQKMYCIYARLKPERIWIDDDVRMTLRADLHSPCFCSKCLAEMKRRTGCAFSRGRLLKEIMADPPNPVRDAWLEYQHQLERDIVGGLARAVHEVSPQTHVSLMHSWAEIHAAEGRRWGDLIGALGETSPLLRPGIGPYVETTGLGIAEAFSGARLCRAACPVGTELAPEIENYPQSSLFKSVSLVRADLTLSQLIGLRQMTFSIYRFGGRLDLETKREDVWSGFLGDIKPRLQAIANLSIEALQIQGVSLYWHEDSARHARGVADESKPIFTFRQRPWDQTLPLMGIATRYGTGDVTAFAGEQIACLTTPDLNEVFSRAVLLDARAAETLLLMGRADLVGIVRRLPDVNAATETIEDAAFGGLWGDIINTRWTSHAWQFKWRHGAHTISRLRGYRGEARGHGVVLFENRLGGRVVVVPFDSQGPAVFGLAGPFPPLESPSFICRPRQAQLVAALEWAARARLALFMPDSPTVYPLLIEQDQRLVIGAANLFPDPVASLAVRIRKPEFRINRVRVLTANGRWKTCQARIGRTRGGAVTIDTGVSLAYLDVAVLVVE